MSKAEYLIIFFYGKNFKKFNKECGYFRDVPNDGKIEVSHYLAQNFDVSDNESLIIGALILSMINKGSIEPEKEENVGLFGKVKESVNLRLLKEPDTVAELTLYNLLILSAGDDGILQEKELEKYSYKNPEKINEVIESVKNAGEQEFITLGGFTGGAGNCIKDLSDKGKEELSEVIGLKKYLNEFTLIAEREITETIIWKEYMVYATLFGIADKVLEQFKKVYPERFINTGIAEANMITTAAGLATCGKTVFASSFAMFAAGRAYEIVRNAIGYPHMNVKIGATHAGITVGEDGATHQCCEDIALMRSIPGMVVINPADDVEARAAVEAAIVAKTATYDTNTDLSAVNDDVKVSWEWKFEGNDDAKDTALGDAAADDNAATIELTVKTTITQVD